jgi:hypothetical protein
MKVKVTSGVCEIWKFIDGQFDRVFGTLNVVLGMQQPSKFARPDQKILPLIGT